MTSITSSPNLEIRVRPVELRFREDGEGRSVEGYAAVYDEWSEDLGGFRERIAPGAFEGCDMQDVAFLFNHEPDSVMARTSSGTLSLRTDDVGLSFAASLDPSDVDVQRLLPKMQRGDVSKCSFAFYVEKDRWYQEEGQTYRELLKINPLLDVSAVTYPAYPQTSATARARFEEFSESGSHSDEEQDKAAGRRDVRARLLSLHR